jgi:hypothetical protein
MKKGDFKLKPVITLALILLGFVVIIIIYLKIKALYG